MEKDRLKFCIGRFDHYYDSVNSKSAVYLALATFIIGGFIAAYPSISVMVNLNIWIQSLYLIVLVLAILTLITVIISAIPYNGRISSSVFYFGSIAGMDRAEFENRSEYLKDQEEMKDLREQVYYLSKGLKRKFLLLGISGRLFSTQFIIFIPLLILLFINLK